MTDTFRSPYKVTKKVKMRLIGIDSNAYALLGAFAREARRQGWTTEEIIQVEDRAKSSDYNNLLRVLMAHTTETAPNDEDDDNE